MVKMKKCKHAGFFFNIEKINYTFFIPINYVHKYIINYINYRASTEGCSHQTNLQSSRPWGNIWHNRLSWPEGNVCKASHTIPQTNQFGTLAQAYSAPRRWLFLLRSQSTWFPLVLASSNRLYNICTYCIVFCFK